MRYSELLTKSFRSAPFNIFSQFDDQLLASIPSLTAAPVDLELDTVNISFALNNDSSKTLAQGIVEMIQAERQVTIISKSTQSR